MKSTVNKQLLNPSGPLCKSVPLSRPPRAIMNVSKVKDGALSIRPHGPCIIEACKCAEAHTSLTNSQNFNLLKMFICCIQKVFPSPKFPSVQCMADGVLQL